MEDKFNDLGVDAIVGSELMYRAGITETDLITPIKFEKMKDIISYMKNINPQERDHIVDSVLTGKNVDKIDHLWKYISLVKASNNDKSNKMLKDQINFFK